MTANTGLAITATKRFVPSANLTTTVRMYKRTNKAIANKLPPPTTCMCKALFGIAKYSIDVAFTIPVEVDSTGAYCIIEFE